MTSSSIVATAARAPGKIILSGEHSVVYGKPALAMAIDKFVTTTVTQDNSKPTQIKFQFESNSKIVSLHELQLLKTKLEERYQDFLLGKHSIKYVIVEPLELLLYAFIYIVDNLSFHIEGNFKVKVNTLLPLGCGMGVSSAVILSLMHSLINHFGSVLAVDKYLYFGREIENLQHGTSSGLDLFLTLHGGCYLFAEGNISKRALPNIPFMLVNTGKPLTSTGECVEASSRYFKNTAIAEDFTKVTMVLDLALQQGNIATIKQCISENQRLLEYIEVVPNRVANFIKEIEYRGNVAKVSGAGAIAGDHAGMVLVVGTESIDDLISNYGYSVLAVQGEQDGLRIL